MDEWQTLSINSTDSQVRIGLRVFARQMDKLRADIEADRVTDPLIAKYRLEQSLADLKRDLAEDAPGWPTTPKIPTLQEYQRAVLVGRELTAEEIGEYEAEIDRREGYAR